MTPLVSHHRVGASADSFGEHRVLVACPDARPPAYEAAAGLSASGRLDRFVTGYFHDDQTWAGRMAPSRVRRLLRKRSHAGIAADRVDCVPSFDGALAIERRLSGDATRLRATLARWRTERFDRRVASIIARRRPDAVILFSDVGSEVAGPLCKRLGIPTVLSMVHGVVQEERAVLAMEQERSPEAFRLYLGESPIDHNELAWLHGRRLSDLKWADMILVPSDHIARELTRNGVARDRVRVVPYAADTARFRPDLKRANADGCTFLFAGGIAQRKGISYLLKAWQRARRDGWRLQLLGGAPADLGPLEPWLGGVELLGRLPHAEVPARMAAADVFVFPSLFEGSAVVTYEALACGLPCVVTPAAGSVVRDGVEGLIVEPADVDALAAAMERVGTDHRLREEMGAAARRRALEFDWPRYHESVNEAVAHLLDGRLDSGGRR